MEEVQLSPDNSVANGPSGETDQSSGDGMGSDLGIKFKNPGDGNYVMFGDDKSISMLSSLRLGIK